MAQLLDKCGIRLTSHQLEQLWSYHNLLRLRNEDRDLTRITGFEPMVLKHYVDCMIVGDHVRLPSPIADVGTGAGFPGIPLKIRYPALQITLAEPRPRRVAFLREAITKLGLKNADVFEHKVTSQSFKKPVAGIVTRALETMDKTILRTSGSLSPGGRLVFLKGPAVEEEFDLLQKRFGDRCEVTEDIRFRLPLIGHDRRIVVVTVKKPIAGIASAEELEDNSEGDPDS